MQPVNGAGGTGRIDAVEPTATVEDLLARLAGGSTGFRVTEGGASLGAIDAAAVLSVVDRDRQRRR